MMNWLLLPIGMALIWAGWDAFVQLGVVRPLTRKEISKAIYGLPHIEVSKPMERRARKYIPAHNSLEITLALLFILSGIVMMGLWVLSLL